MKARVYVDLGVTMTYWSHDDVVDVTARTPLATPWRHRPFDPMRAKGHLEASVCMVSGLDGHRNPATWNTHSPDAVHHEGKRGDLHRRGRCDAPHGARQEKRSPIRRERGELGEDHRDHRHIKAYRERHRLTSDEYQKLPTEILPTRALLIRTLSVTQARC